MQNYFFVRHLRPSKSLLYLFVSTCLIKTVPAKAASIKHISCAIFCPSAVNVFFNCNKQEGKGMKQLLLHILVLWLSFSLHLEFLNVYFCPFLEKQLSLIWFCSCPNLIGIIKYQKESSSASSIPLFLLSNYVTFYMTKKNHNTNIKTLKTLLHNNHIKKYQSLNKYTVKPV